MATVLSNPEQEQAPAVGGTPPPAPGPGGPAAMTVSETPARLCKACGAAMSEDQDWCLECGTARPGRLGGRPGWRAASAVSGATLLLVCGAVAASYAAITDDAGRTADQPGGGSATPVAQAPAAIPGGVTTTGPLTPITPGATTTGQVPGLPQLPGSPTGSTTSPTISGVPAYPNSVNNTGTTTSTSSTPTQTTQTTTTSTTTTTTGSTTSTTTTPAALTPITLGTDATDGYDPYGRATSKGDPADAVDPKAKEAWFVTTPADGKPMQVGLLIDLESRKSVRQIEFATKTPGFRVEVYATDGSALPPDILDTRWAHVASRSAVDQNDKSGNVKDDGKEIIKLPSTAPQARKIVLWFTTAPDAGSTVRLRDLVLKG